MCVAADCGAYKVGGRKPTKNIFTISHYRAVSKILHGVPIFATYNILTKVKHNLFSMDFSRVLDVLFAKVLILRASHLEGCEVSFLTPAISSHL